MTCRSCRDSSHLEYPNGKMPGRAVEVHEVILCSRHDGSMEARLAEALKEMITHHERGYGPLTRGMRNRFDMMLSEYEKRPR